MTDQKKISEWLWKECKKVAHNHAAIIEDECKRLCERYNVEPDQLIIKYYQTARIEIDFRPVV